MDNVVPGARVKYNEIHNHIPEVEEYLKGKAEGLVTEVYRVVGDSRCAPSGEPYLAFAPHAPAGQEFGLTCAWDRWIRAYAHFVQWSAEEGSPYRLGGGGNKIFLYWRHYPAFEYWDDANIGEDGRPVPTGEKMVTLYARLLITRDWKGG